MTLNTNPRFNAGSRNKTLLMATLMSLTEISAFGQRPLANSRQSSVYTYIYQISPGDVLKMYKDPDGDIDEKILVKPLDSVKTDKYWENNLPVGNYLKVFADHNSLKYDLIENHTAFLRLFANDYDKRFVFFDKTGKPLRPDAVKFNGHDVRYDIKSNTYHTETSKKTAIVEADFDGVANFFRVKEKDYDEDDDKDGFFASLWKKLTGLFKNSGDDNYHSYHPIKIKHMYNGFIIFNKPIYRPNDTVKLKAFLVETNSKKPATRRELLVRLKNGYNDSEKTIGTATSYRDGGFTFDFELNDSLKLTLDRDCTVLLEDPAITRQKTNENNRGDIISEDGHRVLISSNFGYEDYDLKSINFKARMEKTEQRPGEPGVIYLKATDENDLPVPDGRIILTLTTNRAQNFKTNRAFVPDTLWTHELKLDPIGETKVIIPDSIFPKADIDYGIDANFLNSANEDHDSRLDASYKFERFNISTELDGDTLKASYREFGKDITGAATIAALDANDDTLSSSKVMLPASIVINPYATSYNIETDSTDTDFDFKDEKGNISLAADRTADSLFVKVDNPRHLHFWYSVFAGARLIDAGDADQLNYKIAYSRAKRLDFLVHYMWGGEIKTAEANELVYRADKLNIAVKQPVTVYPGQQVRTDILVTDVEGTPVADADLTAWSLTKKFNNYRTPSIPYLGPPYPIRKRKTPFEANDADANGQLSLNWKRWSQAMGLDSIAYYKFTHTQAIYRMEERGIDTITQIAPFIVSNGAIIPVHILYIDERPVYFSQAQQLQRYSFNVSPGKHMLRFRTGNQMIKLDSVSVEKSKKLILGLNAEFAHSVKVSDTLSDYEASLINKYMITVVNNFAQQRALVTQRGQIFFLNSEQSGGNTILTGPLSDNFALLDVQGEKLRGFETEPGYIYQFEPGLLKQTSIPGKYPFNKILSTATITPDYTQYVLTEAQADSIWQDYLDNRSNQQALFSNEQSNTPESGSLLIERIIQKREDPVLIKNIIIYKYNDPDFIRVYPGNLSHFYGLKSGNYRLLFLLKGDKYDLKENIALKARGLNFYRFGITPTHPRDSVSIKINQVIESRRTWRDGSDNNIENDALKLKEAFNDKYLSQDEFKDEISGNIIAADDKLPVIGASVRVKGTGKGAVTDINGNFHLKGPENGKLIVSYIGYVTKEVPIEPGKRIKIALSPSSATLNEVVVIGYNTQLRKDITGSVTIVNGLAGSVAGVVVTSENGIVHLRGMSSLPNQQPLYIIDGVPVKSLAGISPAQMLSINVLKNSAAVALYGSEAANGVVIITTNRENTQISQAPVAPRDTSETMRKNFSDYAYWQPKLRTDGNGKASFICTFPDDITNWRTFVAAINGNRQSGYTQGEIKSFKLLSASFISPLFAIEGDELSAIGKVANYNADKAKVTRTFSYNGQLLKVDSFKVDNAKIDTLNVTATTGTDSLMFEYSIKRDNGYFDGEKRKIPVIKKGIQETKGMFAALDRDTTITLQFDPKFGPVTFRAEASVLPALADEAQHLRDYKYLCNEQLASKLKGFLAEKRIRAYQGEPFRYEKNITGLIKKLQENRRSQGTWGWWKDTDEELWISLHAVEALLDAQHAGYTIDIDQQKLTEYLVYQMESYRGEDKLTCLRLLLKIKAKVDYSRYLTVISKELAEDKQRSEYDHFSLILLQEEAGLPVKLDSLFARERHTLFGNVYWGENSNRFFDNSIQISVLAYKILAAEGKHPELLGKIMGYLLEQRQPGHWRNTYESSLILETLLPDLLKAGKTNEPASITIKGEHTETVTDFPFTATIAHKEVSISKTGGLPVYITGYQQFWNKNPEKVSKDFSVETRFEKNGKEINQLKAGEAVQLKARVTAKGDADFVMVEISIPAGCSYQGKEQSWQNNEVHREYFKEKVNIFCRKLKEGAYEFTVNLVSRYDGKYTLNPAKTEMMYFPVFYGREGMKKVVIGD